jgi:hypothetical protein
LRIQEGGEAAEEEEEAIVDCAEVLMAISSPVVKLVQLMRLFLLSLEFSSGGVVGPEAELGGKGCFCRKRVELGVLVDEQKDEFVFPLAVDDETTAAKDGTLDLGASG